MGTYVYMPEVIGEAEKAELMDRISKLVDQVDHAIARRTLTVAIGELHNEVDNIQNGWRNLEVPVPHSKRRRRSK